MASSLELGSTSQASIVRTRGIGGSLALWMLNVIVCRNGSAAPALSSTLASNKASGAPIRGFNSRPMEDFAWNCQPSQLQLGNSWRRTAGVGLDHDKPKRNISKSVNFALCLANAGGKMITP